jgi:hypothetical protein
MAQTWMFMMMMMICEEKQIPSVKPMKSHISLDENLCSLGTALSNFA